MITSQLSAVQDRVVIALAAGATICEAASQAEVHRNTVANWRRSNPAFRTELVHAMYDRAMLVREQAEALAPTAIATIREILVDPKASSSVRLKAALAILHQASAPPPDPPMDYRVLSADELPPAVMHKNAQIAPATYFRTEPRLGRNEPCLCGSGRKYKYCCLNKVKRTASGHAFVTNSI